MTEDEFKLINTALALDVPCSQEQIEKARRKLIMMTDKERSNIASEFHYGRFLMATHNGEYANERR